MSDRPDKSPEAGALAAEYVLGLLDAGDRAAFEARLASEPALVAEVRAWEGYFATMAEVEVEDVAAPARVWRAVEADLFAPARATAPAAVSLWDRVAFWRGLSLATTGLAALAVVFAVLPPSQPPVTGDEPEVPIPEGIPPGRLLMTHLIPTEGSTLGLAVTREPSGVLQVRRVAGTATEGRAQEVWLILGEDAPISLGLLGDEPLTTITPDAEASRLFTAGAALAISDEPLGGSPTGAPTGAVLAVGTFVAL